MLLGQITFISGKNKLIQIKKKKLKEIAGFINGSLSQIEFDRIKLILIASLILIIFWASFEQAGGLLNIYAYEKTDRYVGILEFEIPASWFQSINPLLIILLDIFCFSFLDCTSYKYRFLTTFIFKIVVELLLWV